MQITKGIVDPQPGAAEAGLCALLLAPELLDVLGASVGDCVRLSTKRGRIALGRITGMLEGTGGGTVRMDRFLRQALKAFPNEDISLERVELAVARTVALTPAIDVAEGYVQQLTHTVKTVLAAQQTPVRPGMLLSVALPDSLASVIYEVHLVQGMEGLIGEDTHLYLALDSEGEHDHGDGPHQHARQRGAERVLDTTYEDIGGLAEQIRAVREYVELPLLFPQVYRQLGIAPPRGIVFYGAPGTGKTLLARSVANEIDAGFTYINGPEVVGSFTGQTEENLRKLFGEASLSPPSIIFIDEIDAIAPARGSAGTLSDARAVTQLLALMDGLKQSEGVVVIGTTNRLEALDPALRRAGRLDRELFFPTPGAAAREQILRVHTREMPLTTEARGLLPDVARRAHGFVGADLMELSREAALSALRRAAGLFLDLPTLAAAPRPADLQVTAADLEDALRRVHPASLRETLVSDPSVTFADIGGLEDVKQRLRTLVERPLRQPELFAAAGLPTSLGVLLYGPPGTGKTLLAQAIAAESGVNFIAVQGPELFSQWLGESEEAVRRVFRTAERAAPCILFFDQLEAMLPRRAAADDDGGRTPRRVLHQMLAELDGLGTRDQVVVVGATNDLAAIDPAALRPGRFGVHVRVDLPDASERVEILRIHLGSGLEGLAASVAARTEGFSGADLALLSQTARLHALERGAFTQAEQLSGADLDAALAEMARDGTGLSAAGSLLP